MCDNEKDCEYFEMLWKWFEDRLGVDDMRANLPEGLSADDFKAMLDEHEAGILNPCGNLAPYPPHGAATATAALKAAVPEDLASAGTAAEGKPC